MISLSKHDFAICLFILAIALSGCLVGSSGYNGQITYRGDITIRNNTFVMDGALVNGGVRNTEFNNVRIYLYYTNGTQINMIRVGTLKGGVNVSVRSDKIPEYVIVDSPDFWNTQKVSVEYFKRMSSGEYTTVGVTERSELPVQPERRRSKQR